MALFQDRFAGQGHVLTTDFSRSFVRFRLDLNETQPKTVSQAPPFTLNNARLMLDCRCSVTRHDGSTTKSIDYVLSVSCKAEQVHVRENIWHDPAADMCLVASSDEFLVIKSWERNNRGVMLNPASLGEQPERQSGKNVDAFTNLRLDFHEVQGQVLSTTEEIVAAVLDNRSLVSQSEFSTPDGSHVYLEYPVKTINASERELFYQTDTGPVLLPDAAAFDGKNRISELRQAFMAHNNSGCTELLVNVPTPVGHGISVNHYSRSLSVKSKNRIIAID